nr:MAG TPA: hypothetical protein [Caudoviricetes sp.]DAT57461.1 MAG TPA: hypothetical protein [Caudoviricetes sp.]
MLIYIIIWIIRVSFNIPVTYRQFVKLRPFICYLLISGCILQNYLSLSICSKRSSVPFFKQVCINES